MIAWLAKLTGFSPILVEVIMAALLAGGAWYGLRLWGNAQWAKGEQQGRENVAADVVKAKQAEWDKKAAELAAEAATLSEQKRTIDVQTSELAATRAATRQALAQIIDAARKSQGESNAQAITVPADQLDSALRSLSADLAAAH